MDLNLTGIPEELKEYSNWVNWTLEEREGKLTKPPINPKTDEYADSTNPSTWATYDQALKHYKECENDRIQGIGFVPTNGYVGVDLDHCRESESGHIESWAQEIVSSLNSYTEITPSGEGLRVWVKGTLPDHGRKKGNIEMYATGRFFTVTGQHLEGTPVEICQREEELKAIHKKVFGNGNKTTPNLKPGDSLSLSDTDLIKKAMDAANGDKFRQLWKGNSSDYPSPSEADLALCLRLAFWTGRDSARIDTLFRQSGLMREKWDEKHFSGGRTYGQATIQTAIEQTTEVYSSPKAQQETTKDKLHYKITTIDEILNYPDPEYLIDKIIIKETLNIIASYAGVGKSIIALSIAKAIMTGRPLWGKFPVLEKGSVLLIDEETPRPFLKERVSGMKFERDLPFPVIHFQGVKIDTDEGMEALQEALDKVKPNVLIIDSFIRIHSADENKTKDMARVMDRLRQIVNRGVIVILIAHHGKGQDRPAEEKLRGVSEIPAGIDIEYSVVDKTDGEAGVKIVEFRSVKTRTKPVEPILLKITFSENPDSEITVEYQGTKAGDALEEIKNVLKEKEIDGKPISEDNGATFSKIEDWLCEREVKVGQKTLRSVLKAAVKNGEILSKQDRFARGKPVVYWMPGSEPERDVPSWVKDND